MRTTPRTRPTACTAPTLMAACVAPPWLPTPLLTTVRLMCGVAAHAGSMHGTAPLEQQQAPLESLLLIIMLLLLRLARPRHSGV
jgi:hypothetical protein